MADVLLEPPAPVDLANAERVRHSRDRRRLMYSQHLSILRERMVRRLGIERAQAVGDPDMTANPFLSLWSQVAVMYDAEPGILAVAGSEALAEQIADGGYWPSMQRTQRDTLGFREMLVRLEADTIDKRVTSRPVFPDLIESAEVHARAPWRPVRIREWVQGVHGWEMHDTASGPCSVSREPFHRVYDVQGHDITRDLNDGATFEGAAYPYRYTDGRARLPYVVYHAAQTPFLFDPFTYREVVEGSVNVCMLLTFYQHIVEHAAWQQRYAFGIVPHGARTVGSEGQQRLEAVADPAVIFTGDLQEGVSNPLIGQWAQPADPEAVLRSIAMYERRIHMIANVQPADVTRQEADVRSGYSLAVSRESVRAAQAVYMPQFRRGDQDMFELAAVISNRAFGTDYAERGTDYRITYQGLPASPGELDAEAAQIQTELDAGRIGPVTAYRRRYPGATAEEAVGALVQAQTERELLDAAVTLARGGDGAPPVATLDTGRIQTAGQIVAMAGRGEVPRASARAMLISLVGVAAEAADAMIDPIPDAPTGAGATP